MRFQCPFCLFIITADDSFIGDLQRPKIGCPNCGKTVFIPTRRFEEGYVVSDFCIQRKIGEGSIGSVFEATQISLNRKVALKILFEEYTNVKGVKDFVKEARTIAQLNHPNLVQCYAVGEEDGVCFMAMDYIKGESVKTKLRKEGKVSLDEALHITQQVAEALYYAWDEANLIHRDVKPDNIMINDEGIVKLTDLGLAMYTSDWKEDMEISGSPSYMSPEQFAGEQLDTRCDIYSLGVTLYQMLSGILPFEGETIRTIVKQHFHEEAVSLSAIDPKIPSKVVNLVEKMMAKLQKNRFQTMEDLLNAIWMVRQRTAPDKELVPDVHTISMKRLDYELQKETTRRQEEISRSLYSILGKAALIGTPVIVVIVLVILILYSIQEQHARKQRAKIDIINTYLNSDDQDLDFVQKRARDMLVEYQNPHFQLDHELRAKLQYYLAQISNRKLQNKIKELNNTIEVFQKHEKELEEKVQAIIEQKKEQSEEKEKLSATQKTMNDQLAALNRALEKEKSDNAKLQKDLQELDEKRRDLLFSSLRVRTYNLIKTAKFKRAASIIKAEAEEGDYKGDKWFDQYLEILKELEELHGKLSDSGTKFATIEIPEYGKIVAIKDGDILYQDSLKQIKKKEWQDFSTTDLYAVIGDETIDLSEAEKATLKAEIALLQGDPYKAKEMVPEDSYINKIYLALKEFNSDSVTKSSTKKKKKAKSSVKTEIRTTTKSSKSNDIKIDVPEIPRLKK